MKTAGIYARCSTDMQDQSINDQLEAIHTYAEANGIRILENSLFLDEGKSGVLIKHREAFNWMMKQIEVGDQNFEFILVYDVSRWGRFANDDEAAYWEHHCRRHNVEVVFTNEVFSNDNSLPNRLVKNLKRSMASEFSRKLSLDVTRGLRSNASKGYWNGSSAPYGYKRAVVDDHGTIVRVLEDDEQKIVRGQHIKLVPGKKEEIEIIRKIFDDHDKGLGIRAITNGLNKQGIRSPGGKKWNTSSVHNILTNPAYIGTVRWGRTKNGVFSKTENTWNDKNGLRTLHDKESMVIVENAHEGVIDKKQFERVQKNLVSKIVCKKSSDGRPYGSSYLATGLLVCANCGSKYIGRTYLRPQRNKPIQYYWCNGSAKNGSAFCKQYTIHREDIDSFLVEEVLKRVNNPHYLEKIESIIQDKRREQYTGKDYQLNLVEEEINRINAALEVLMNEIEESPESTRELVRSRIVRRQQEKEELLRRKQDLILVKQEKSSLDQQILRLRNFISQIDTRVLSPEVSDDPRESELKKKIIRCFAKSGVVNRDTKSVDFFFYKVPATTPSYPSYLPITNSVQSPLWRT